MPSTTACTGATKWTFSWKHRAGRLVGIEVKASATLGARDVAGLAALRDAFPDRFQDFTAS
ncbi:MAG: hypothetical protein JXB39_03860 [Deltaproteobacteria bacterium]|nr:hypothetical protein [Deltaproteobacteria bacterium]